MERLNSFPADMTTCLGVDGDRPSASRNLGVCGVTGAPTLAAVTPDRGRRFVEWQESSWAASGSWFSLLPVELADCLVRFLGVSMAKSKASVSNRLCEAGMTATLRGKSHGSTFIAVTPRPLSEGGARHCLRRRSGSSLPESFSLLCGGEEVRRPVGEKKPLNGEIKEGGSEADGLVFGGEEWDGARGKVNCRSEEVHLF